MSELLTTASTLASVAAEPEGSRVAPTASYGDLQLVIEDVPIGDLKSYARNARTHSKAQIRQIADSLLGFGFVSPIVVDRDGTIIAGHGRVAAAKLIGRKTVPTVRADHLTDDQVKALRIADNRLAELAGWDSNLLALEFNDLLEIDLKAELSFDLAITGFAPAEIDRMVEAARENEEAAKDDAVP
ncbi:MAG TPA: ParB/Srx family N-terminal domain-containing protein, partial [Thermomicrobiales bacterium]|nr:ParB/Srx family N-terminal domain-containing protein [Thermomicrobiales bacterium]